MEGAGHDTIIFCWFAISQKMPSKIPDVWRSLSFFGFVGLLVLSAAQVLTLELNRVHYINSATQGLLQQHWAYSSWTVSTPLLMEFAPAAESIFHYHCHWGCTAQGIIQLQWLSKCGAGAHRWSTLLLLIPVASQLNKILPMRSYSNITATGIALQRARSSSSATDFPNVAQEHTGGLLCSCLFLLLANCTKSKLCHQIWSSCWLQRHFPWQLSRMRTVVDGFEKNKH